jgi:AP endonuclease 1
MPTPRRSGKVIEETIVQEAEITIIRSSPRRRKGEEQQVHREHESFTSPRSKRLKTNTTETAADHGTEVNQVVSEHSPRKSARTQKAEDIVEKGEKVLDSYSNVGGVRTEIEGETPQKKKRKAYDSQKDEPDINGVKTVIDPETPPNRKHKAKARATKTKDLKEQDTDLSDSTKDPSTTTPKNPKRKRKTKEEKEAEAMPLAARTTGLRMHIGAHVSVAKGLQNSVTNSTQIGGNAFALFLKSQRKWDNPSLTDASCDAFTSHCQLHNYDAARHVLPHGSYLVNLAQEDKDKAKQAYDAFLDDLRRCESLGIKLYNFHPGAASSSPLPTAIKRIAEQLNTALAATETVTPVLENMAGSGTVIGSRFSDLRDIIAHIRPEFKDRIGVCIDTCHAFAAGYDLRTPELFKAVLRDFDETVGMRYLKALHLNDSKAPLGSKRDLHQNIGVGFLGLRAFHNVMNETRFEGLPLILETPCEKPDPRDPSGKKTLEDKSVWAREIKLLESLIGMDVDSEEFRGLERELSEKGREEREKMMRSIEAREGKASKKKEREREKGQKSLKDMMNGVAKARKGKGRAKGEKGGRSGKKEGGSSAGESSSELSELD